LAVEFNLSPNQSTARAGTASTSGFVRDVDHSLSLTAATISG
jgi:hypothetical protein